MAFVLLLLLLWTGSCPVLADKPKPCHLYTVYRDEPRQWDLPDDKVLLTLAPVFIQGNEDPNSKVFSSTISQLNLKDGPCLVKINHRTQTQEDTPCLLNVNNEEELVGVVVWVTNDRVWVSTEGAGEWKNATNSANTRTITVTTDDTVNVAFACPEGCFQFSDATIAKNVIDPGSGSLIFYGRPTATNTQFGKIILLRGERGWTHQLQLVLEKYQPDNNSWTKFSVTGNFTKKRNGPCDDGYEMEYIFFIGSNVARDGSGKSSRCVPGPSLIMQFSTTTNMEWALCKPPEAEGSTHTPSEGRGITTSAPMPLTPSAGRTTLSWWYLAGGGAVVCVLVVALVVTCMMLYRARKQDTTTLVKDTDDPDNHVYDYVDLSQVRGNPTRVTRENSLYGCVIQGLE